MTPERPDTNGHYGAMALCYGGMICVSIVTFLIPIYLTTWSATFGGTEGLRKEQLGLISSCLISGFCVSILVSAWVASRVRPKALVVTGSALICTGMLILAGAWRYEMLLAGSTVAGFGAGVLEMLLSPIVCELRPTRKTSAMNWLHSMYCIGGIATALVASLAIREGINWRVVCAGAMAAPFVELVGFALLRLPPLSFDADADVLNTHKRMRAFALLRTPWFLCALVCMAVAGGTELGVAQWIPAFASNTLRFGTWEAGMTLIGFSLVMGIGRGIAGLFGHWVSPLVLLLLACISTSLAIFLGAYSASPVVAISACMAVGFTLSCMWPTVLALCADHFPGAGPTMFALLSAFGNAGGIVMPWFIGLVADHTTLRTGLATTGLCPVAMLAALAYFRSHERNRRRH